MSRNIDLARFSIGAVEGGASRVIEVLKNRTVSKDHPIRQEISFGGSTGSVTVTPIGRGPSGTTFTVRIIATEVHEKSYAARVGTNYSWINQGQSFPILPKGKLTIEVLSSSPTDWVVYRVVIRYMNGISYTITGETPAPPSPCTCAILLVIITSILGLLMQVL